jgi:Tol biopolymer transport system component
MRKRYFIYLTLSVFLIFGCNPKINYNLTSVPEEGGIRFTQFTTNEESIVHPVIVKDKDVINWYAPPLIAVSPSGDDIAYLGSKNNTWNIMIKSTKGGRATLQRTFRDKVLDMTFSPNGEKIAFTEEKDGSKNIYVVNAKAGMAVQQITSTNSDELGPSYSPDSRHIFFTKSENSYINNTLIKRHYIWSFDTETSLLTQYSEGFTPSMLPDGEQMVITRNNKQTGKGEIWLINFKKGQETLLISSSEKGFSSPQVSPDGKRVLCVGNTLSTSQRPANLDIYMFNIDGTNLTQLTFHPGHDVSPKWSPDGGKIYFLSQRGNSSGQWNVWNMEFMN